MTLVYEDRTQEMIRNGNSISYKIYKGTAYHEDTPEAVVEVLSNAISSRSGAGNDIRLRLFYGDADTGRDWCEEYDTIGYIGRSCGRIKIPLLIKTVRSSGGVAILDHCIVKIMQGKYTVYQHPSYYQPEFIVVPVTSEDLIKVGYTHGVLANGAVRANFKSEVQAQRYVEFMQGKRNSK